METLGTVGILTGRGPAIDELGAWLDALPPDIAVLRKAGNQVAWQRNRICEEFRGDWLLFVDADCVPPPGALDRLLAHDAPVVSGVVLERRVPFRVCAVRSLEPFRRLSLLDLPASGLLPVTAVGAGCLLIRRPVIAALGPHVFRCGQIAGAPDLLAEDLDFSLRAAEAGFPPLLDCGVRVGHRVEALLWPGEQGAMVQWEGGDGNRVPYREPLPQLDEAATEAVLRVAR